MSEGIRTSQTINEIQCTSLIMTMGKARMGNAAATMTVVVAVLLVVMMIR